MSRLRIKRLDQLRRRGGFTLVEVMLVAGLMSMLLVLISVAWAGAGKPSVEAIAECRVSAAAALALQSFARDFSGSRADQNSGGKALGRLVGRTVVTDSELRLCFDGNPTNGVADWALPDSVVVFRVAEGKLLRSNPSSGTAVVVADSVEDMRPIAQPDGVQIDLTFGYRNIRRTYTLVAKDPPPLQND